MVQYNQPSVAGYSPRGAERRQELSLDLTGHLVVQYLDQLGDRDPMLLDHTWLLFLPPWLLGSLASWAYSGMFEKRGKLASVGGVILFTRMFGAC